MSFALIVAVLIGCLIVYGVSLLVFLRYLKRWDVSIAKRDPKFSQLKVAFTDYPMFSIVKDGEGNKSLVVGYTNVPTDFSTAAQSESYPLSLILLNYDEKLDIYYTSLSKFGDIEASNIWKGDRELIIDVFSELTKTPSVMVYQFNNTLKSAQISSGLDLTHVKSWVEIGKGYDCYRVKIAKALSTLIHLSDSGRCIAKPSIYRGSVWVHNKSNCYYEYIGCIECHSTKVPYLIYYNVWNGRLYSRRASDWNRSMALVADASIT